MKLSLLTLLIVLSSTISYAQVAKKDSIPSVKTFYISITEPDYRFVDSILTRSYGYVGKAGLFEEVDLLRSNLALVIRYFQEQVAKQKTPINKPKN